MGLAESELNAPGMGFGGVEFYPDVVDQAAVLCVRLARNQRIEIARMQQLLAERD